MHIINAEAKDRNKKNCVFEFTAINEKFALVKIMQFLRKLNEYDHEKITNCFNHIDFQETNNLQHAPLCDLSNDNSCSTSQPLFTSPVTLLSPKKKFKSLGNIKLLPTNRTTIIDNSGSKCDFMEELNRKSPLINDHTGSNKIKEQSSGSNMSKYGKSLENTPILRKIRLSSLRHSFTQQELKEDEEVLISPLKFDTGCILPESLISPAKQVQELSSICDHQKSTDTKVTFNDGIINSKNPYCSNPSVIVGMNSQELFSEIYSSKNNDNFAISNSQIDGNFPDLSQGTLSEIEKVMIDYEDPYVASAKTISIVENPFLSTTNNLNNDNNNPPNGESAHLTFGGFSTAGGKTIKGPSKTAISKISHLFEETETPSPKNVSCSFSSASGKKLDMPSSAALEKVSKLFAEKTPSTFQSNYSPVTSGFATTNGKFLHTPSTDFIKQTKNLLTTSNNTIKIQNPLLTPFKTPFREASGIITPSSIRNPPFKPPTAIKSISKESTSNITKSTNTTKKTIAFFDFTSSSSRLPLLEFVSYKLPCFLKNSSILDCSFSEISATISTLIPSLETNWITNHFYLIHHKLNSLMNSFREKFTFNQHDILNELLYRYQVEFQEGKRSILRKIAEKDDISSRHMVLYVSDIIHSPDEENFSHLILSDGWYYIKAAIDEPMKWLVIQRKIFIGQKLHIFGAQCEFLSSSNDGIPILEAFNKIQLKLNTNSVRRAMWYESLGVKKPTSFLTSLNTIYPDGGLISCVDVVIQRVYPLSYMEQNGNKTFLTEKEESIRSKQWLQKLDQAVELAVEKYSKDPDGGRENLEEEIDELKRSRSVTSLFRCKIRDYSVKKSREAIFSFWRPTEELLEIFKEGRRVRILCPKATSSFKGILSLSNTKNTIIKPIQSVDENILKSCYAPRVVITKFAFLIMGEECDIQAIVCDVTQISPSNTNFITIAVKDGNGDDGVIRYVKKVSQNELLHINSRITVKNLILNFYDEKNHIFVFSLTNYSEIKLVT